MTYNVFGGTLNPTLLPQWRNLFTAGLSPPLWRTAEVCGQRGHYFFRPGRIKDVIQEWKVKFKFCGSISGNIESIHGTCNWRCHFRFFFIINFHKLAQETIEQSVRQHILILTILYLFIAFVRSKQQMFKMELKKINLLGHKSWQRFTIADDLIVVPFSILCRRLLSAPREWQRAWMRLQALIVRGPISARSLTIYSCRPHGGRPAYIRQRGTGWCHHAFHRHPCYPPGCHVGRRPVGVN